MGYRSEVAIKCEKKAFEMFRETYNKVDFPPDKVYKDGKHFILYWDWVKWYDTYEDVGAVESVMDELNELQDLNNGEETGYGYRFMRLGEEDNDIETRENSWDIELWMTRKIDIPEGLEEVEI